MIKLISVFLILPLIFVLEYALRVFFTYHDDDLPEMSKIEAFFIYFAFFIELPMSCFIVFVVLPMLGINHF